MSNIPNRTLSLRDTVGVAVNPRSYRNVLYLVVGFPLGLIYAVGLTVGLAVGASFALFLVGVPVVVGTVAVSRFVADFERRLANRLLDAGIPKPDDTPARTDDEPLHRTALAYLGAPSTWKGIVFLYVRFWLGVAAFTVAAVLLGASVALMTAPLHYTDPNIGFVGFSVFDSRTEAFVGAPVGIVAVLVSLHVLNGLARLSERFAAMLLSE